jgi:hypothetical protein
MKKRTLCVSLLVLSIIATGCSTNSNVLKNKSEIKQNELSVEQKAYDALNEKEKLDVKNMDAETVITEMIKSINQKNKNHALSLFKENSYINLNNITFDHVEIIEGEKNAENKKQYLLKVNVKGKNSTWSEGENKKIVTLQKKERWVIEKIENATEKTFIAKNIKPVEVKGLYVSGPSVGLKERFNHLINLIDKTELNTMVIDVKEDSGFITYDSNVKLANAISADKNEFIKDIKDKVKILKNKGIYTIARVVVFKDPQLAKTKPELAMKRKDGTLYYSGGVPWVDPYKKEVWDYVINVAKEAAIAGFDEIQFDYVRFPENGKAVDAEVNFDNPNHISKEQNIANFVSYASGELKPYGVYISADVFGLVTSVDDDMGIGQKWELLSPELDYISPMTYPSHYGPGVYGFAIPDAHPYGVIKKAMEDALKKNELLKTKGQRAAIIRPWFQDFTATWVPGHIPYGAKEVTEQIRAAKELGIRQYIIWSPGNQYSESAWK